MRKSDAEKIAREVFGRSMNINELAEKLGTTPGKARQIWGRIKRKMADEKLTVGATREFVAETDEVLMEVESKLLQEIHAYQEGGSKLNALAAAVKVFRETRETRHAMRRDMGLMPGNPGDWRNRPRAEPAPAPAAAEPEQEPAPELPPQQTVEEMDLMIEAMKRERDRMASK